MSKPSYLALRFFQFQVRAFPWMTGSDPEDLLSTRVLEIQNLFQDPESKAYIADLMAGLVRPEHLEQDHIRSVDDAEIRFLDVLLHGHIWNMDLVKNNLGKAGNDLGLKAPFLY